MSITEERAPDPVRYLEDASADLVGLLRSGIDPDLVALGEWTTRDVAAHLAGLMGVYAGFVRGDIDDDDSDVESAPNWIARANALCVADRATVSLDDIADEIEAAVRSFVDELARHDPAEAISLWQARPGRPDVLAGFALMEFLVHGDDIARAAKRPWPIPTEAARAAWARWPRLGDVAALGHRHPPPGRRGGRRRRRAQRPGTPVGARRDLYAVWANAALSWAHGAFDDEEFVVAALHGLHLALFAVASDETRPRIERALDDTGRRLAASVESAADATSRRTA